MSNNKNDYIICLDNGHGMDTPGKCSPDKKLKEYQYAREIVKRLEAKLKENGYKVYIVTPEQEDISLKERCKRINKIYKDNGNKAISISIKKLAKNLYDEALLLNLKGNRSVPKEHFWVQNLAMCRDTNCPAVLTENLFQDNKEDVSFLLSEKGKQAIVDVHYNGIVKYLG